MDEQQKKIQQDMIDQIKAQSEDPNTQIVNEIAMPGVTIKVNDK